MKVYQTSDHRFYEKQTDVPKGHKFKAVEFPFSASPKQDFVDWLNDLDYGPGVSTRIAEQPVTLIGLNLDSEPLGTAQPAPHQPASLHADQIIAFEDGFAAMALATKLHFAGLAVEEARGSAIICA